MAVMRTYWARALTGPLADVHRATQTLPLSKHGGARNVGLDMPVEQLNKDIKADAERSEAGIKAYCERRDFIAAVGDGVNSLMYVDRSELKDALREALAERMAAGVSVGDSVGIIEERLKNTWVAI